MHYTVGICCELRLDTAPRAVAVVVKVRCSVMSRMNMINESSHYLEARAKSVLVLSSSRHRHVLVVFLTLVLVRQIRQWQRQWQWQSNLSLEMMVIIKVKSQVKKVCRFPRVVNKKVNLFSLHCKTLSVPRSLILLF